MIKILVATDLSERSAHAVQRAVQLIRRQGGGEWSLLHLALHVRSSHLPVLRVNGPVTHEYRQALVAMDLSRTSQQALKRARDLGLASLDKLSVASAVEPVAAGVVMEAGISAEVLENQRELLRQQLVERLDALGATLSHERLLVQVGSPEGVVGEALSQSGADLLVLGTHAREGVSRFFLGSVASRLLGTLDCDALIVPPAG